MSVKHLNEFESTVVEGGVDVSRQMLIPLGEAPNFAMRCFTIQPGGSMPLHTNLVEHEQFVIHGRAEVGIGEEVHEVKEGDVVYIPPDVPHFYRTLGEEPFKFLCLVPDKKDQTTILQN